MNPDHPHDRLRAALDELRDALLDAAVEDARRARDALLGLRRDPAVVLWGGRPGLDLQLGSPADVARARRMAAYRGFALAMRRATLAHQRVGTTFAEATAGMRRALADLERASRSVEAAQARQAAMRDVGRRIAR